MNFKLTRNRLLTLGTALGLNFALAGTVMAQQFVHELPHGEQSVQISIEPFPGQSDRNVTILPAPAQMDGRAIVERSMKDRLQVHPHIRMEMIKPVERPSKLKLLDKQLTQELKEIEQLKKVVEARKDRVLELVQEIQGERKELRERNKEKRSNRAMRLSTDEATHHAHLKPRHEKDEVYRTHRHFQKAPKAEFRGQGLQLREPAEPELGLKLKRVKPGYDSPELGGHELSVIQIQ